MSDTEIPTYRIFKRRGRGEDPLTVLTEEVWCRLAYGSNIRLDNEKLPMERRYPHYICIEPNSSPDHYYYCENVERLAVYITPIIEELLTMPNYKEKGLDEVRIIFSPPSDVAFHHLMPKSIDFYVYDPLNPEERDWFLHLLLGEFERLKLIPEISRK